MKGLVVFVMGIIFATCIFVIRGDNEEVSSSVSEVAHGPYKIKGRFVCEDGEPAKKGGLVKVIKWVYYKKSENDISKMNVLDYPDDQIKISDNGTFEHLLPFHKTAERDKSVKLQFKEILIGENAICQKEYSESKSTEIDDNQISKDFRNVKLSPRSKRIFK